MLLCCAQPQSCPTLCGPMDCRPPDFSVHGILQARTLEWVASHSLLQKIFPTQGLNPGLPHCRQILHHLSQGSPYIYVYQLINISVTCLGEGNGNPLQFSCLENPVDRGAWWAAVHRVTQSRTRLKQLSMHACIGEGNGNPLQYSWLENPRDRGAWRAAVCGVAQSRTWLKSLSSSSRMTCLDRRKQLLTIYENFWKNIQSIHNGYLWRMRLESRMKEKEEGIEVSLSFTRCWASLMLKDLRNNILPWVEPSAPSDPCKTALYLSFRWPLSDHLWGCASFKGQGVHRDMIFLCPCPLIRLQSRYPEPLNSLRIAMAHSRACLDCSGQISWARTGPMVSSPLGQKSNQRQLSGFNRQRWDVWTGGSSRHCLVQSKTRTERKSGKTQVGGLHSSFCFRFHKGEEWPAWI